MKFLKDYEINSYDNEIVNEEREEIDVVYTTNSKSKLNKGLIYLNVENDPSIVHLEKYAFSNAIALSGLLHANRSSSIHKNINSRLKSNYRYGKPIWIDISTV